jgi:type IV pilus assembly protein PilX
LVEIMLSTPNRRPTSRAPAPQRGAVLLVALIMLVLLTLAGIGLMRSVSTSNVIAGNLAFKQAAMHSADRGVESAITFLEANSGGATLTSSVLSGAGTRYVARRDDPATGVTWDTFWSTLAASGAVNTLASDAAGNTVAYVIHRLCNSTGDVAAASCSQSPQDASRADESRTPGPQPKTPPQIYYRITTRVTGPRNTLSYVQVVVAI